MTGAAVRRPPSATRGRYLLIMVVLLLGGALAGQLTHHLTVGLDWRDVTVACFRDAAAQFPGDPLRRAPVVNSCRAGVEHRYALFAAAGALLTLAAALLLARLQPRLLLRRLGPRRPAPFTARAAEIAAGLGVRRPPVVEFGPFTLREPFTVRSSGATRIVLPPGARRLPADHLDAVLRHETAHAAAGDVTLVWLTRGLLWALPVVMAVPLLVAPFRDGLNDFPFWLRYGVRAALLWTAGYLLTRAVMRDRELEADHHAARAGSADALRTLLAPTHHPAAHSTRARRLLATHPQPARRVAVLREPARLLGMPALVAWVAGVLAVNIWSAGSQILLSALLGTALEPYPQLVAGLAAGALLVATWGLAMWRRAAEAGPPRAPAAGTLIGPSPGAALGSAAGTLTGPSPAAGTVTGPSPAAALGSAAGTLTGPPRAATLGLLAGALTGLLVNLDPRSLAGDWTIDWWAVLYVPLALGGAAGCVLALSCRRRPWPVVLALGTAVFAGALWIGFGMAAQQALAVQTDLPAAAAVLWTAGFGSAWLTPATVTVVALAVAAASSRAALLGLLAGLLTLAARWLTPLAALDLYPEAQRDWWASATAAITLTVLLLLLRGAAGLADALIAAPAAALTVTAGVLLRYLSDWDDPVAAARVYVTRPLTMLAVLTLAVAATACFLPSRPGRPGWRGAAVLALTAAAAASTLLLSGDGLLTR
ncbi:M48 family metalloprotease [Paractinoplanes brasiliensis]|uniref:Zn-dependent protease with chaperone function n=1 Tax=Paractinoplanes brasiliensis TaxID=52695 RepID=A0A4R6JC31_9ACTN|nr:M48 family metalloprotease [Actinoplanes brasiliensis]TDO32075.1 Zn-dependent protease with chaperone function [Actinoplanes brasiliensis]GID28123.1 hypothetical protein Abr02nite_31060 [Actinoplanes brasiliensis]